MNGTNQVNFLSFNFDVSAYRLLGRELITDRITALFEIVKNAYDANANRVEIEFLDVQPRTKKSKIIIKDDGLGMTLDDLKNKWMVIGTSSKHLESVLRLIHIQKGSWEKRNWTVCGRFIRSKTYIKNKKEGQSGMDIFRN